MKTFYTTAWLFISISFFVFIGCTIDYTEYYADSEDPGLAIFSNKGNNLMTCYINGKPWRTTKKRTTFPGGLRLDVSITRFSTTSALDTLQFLWSGDYNTNGLQAAGELSLLLPVPKTFSIKDISALQGQRLSIDTANNTGAFVISYGTKGNGNIFFQTAKVDSVSPGIYVGRISGLLDANLPGYAVTRGRFDHSLVPEQLRDF